MAIDTTYDDLEFKDIFSFMNLFITDTDKALQFFQQQYEDYNLTEPIILTGDTTTGSAVIQNLSSTLELKKYMFISGDGIPEDSLIISIDSATQITISENATSTGTVSIEFKYMNLLLRWLKGRFKVRDYYNQQTIDEIYSQRFISSATGKNLDTLGEEKNVFRLPGETDSSYRDRIKGFVLITNKGNPIEAVIELIESYGYTVNFWFKDYYRAFYTDSTGVYDYMYTDSTGVDGILLCSQYRQNYTIHFRINEAITESELSDINNQLYYVKKAYNFILIRTV